VALQLVTDLFSPTANTYVSVEEMTDYVSTRVADPTMLDAWLDLDPDRQIMYLVNATRSIDMMSTWIGDKYSQQQGLDWPRYNVWYEGYILNIEGVAPQRVKEATCEMALWMMQNSGAMSTGSNVAYDSIKVGPIAIDFNEGAGGTSKVYFPDIIPALLKGLADVQNPDLPSTNKLKIARLYRA
jgi:hypothetical protein